MSTFKDSIVFALISSSYYFSASFTVSLSAEVFPWELLLLAIMASFFNWFAFYLSKSKPKWMPRDWAASFPLGSIIPCSSSHTVNLSPAIRPALVPIRELEYSKILTIHPCSVRLK
jgi:hypothetical protein